MKLKRIDNKRAELTDTFTILIWLFIMGIAILVIMFITSSIWTGLRSVQSIVEVPEANQTLTDTGVVTTSILPSGLLVIFFGLILGLMVTSFYTRVHPVFLPVYIIFAIIAVILAVILGNAWESFASHPDFAVLLASSSMAEAMNLIMTNLVKISVVMSILGIIIIFAKPSPGGGGEPY